MSEESPGDEPADGESAEERAAEGDSVESPEEERVEEAPLSDLARSFEESGSSVRGETAASADALESDPFEEMDVSEVDSEAVWEAVVEEETDGTGPGPGGPGGVAETVEPAGEASQTEHVVGKREFCHRCSYFAEPPETACTHEGTEIVEAVDSERFRVRNCPMVGEDERPDFEQG